jgi:hypothetical protein
MNFIKKILLLSITASYILFSSNVFSITHFGGNMDHSQSLHKLLKVKAQKLDYPYTFEVYKENDYYNVIIKKQNNKIIKQIPESYVNKLFDSSDVKAEKYIINIIFIPGKE